MRCLICDKEIGDYYWCSIEHKYDFLIENYGLAALPILNDYAKQKAEKKEEQLNKYANWKKDNPTKELRDYLLDLGTFKNDD